MAIDVEKPVINLSNRFAGTATDRYVNRFAGPARTVQSFLQGSQEPRPVVGSSTVPLQGSGSVTGTYTGPSRSTEPILSLNLSNLLQGNATVECELTNQLYDIELYITNSFGKIFTISPVAIHNFTIDDNITQIGSDGSLTINFDNDRAESFDNFVFSNDGEDFLRFRLIPKNNSSTESINFNKKIWELNFIFSIYDVHDVTPKSRGNTDATAYTKLRKLFIKDVRRQLLETLNIEYSTAFSQYAPITFLPPDFLDRYLDSNRSIKTGYCIDEIIKQSFNYDSILAKTGLDVNASEDWDLGSTDIFYTSGSAETSMELLMNIFKRHVSKNIDDFNLLTISREENGIGYFSLRSMQNFFENAGSSANAPGKLQIEHFFLRNSLDTTEGAGRMFRAPILQDGTGRPRNDYERDIKANDYNIIDSYEFVDISPNINANMFNTRCVYSFDFNLRQFNVEFEKHSINTTSNTITDKYINKLYKGRGGNNFLINNSSKIKQMNKNVTPQFTPYGDSTDSNIRLPDGFQKLLKTGLLQNTCINFTVPGLTIRQAGVFIGIDRLNGSIDNKFDDKICGQWFVIDVKHIIAAGMYYNTITAVKIHSYTPAYVGDINTRDSGIRFV